MRIAPEGWIIIVPFCLIALAVPALLAVLLGFLGLGAIGGIVGTIMGFISLLLIIWCFWFFRDPERTVPTGVGQDSFVISPADGKVILVDQAAFPKELQGGDVTSQPVPRIAIFLNVFNVHVNRVPTAGTIEKVVYTKGQFLTASLDKASTENERSCAIVRDKFGRAIGFAQIAGLVARRIVNHLKVGQSVSAGERFGLIRFGSRAELFLPPGTSINVKVGQHVVAGETILATLPGVNTVTAPSVSDRPAAMAGA